jgi:hypothetical protein
MIYREAGQFKTTYAADQAVFPIAQDRVVVVAAVAAAFVVPPLAASEYWLQAVLIPFLVYALAAIGLNLLTGYAGQLSLGTGGFMAVGAYAAFKLATALPHLNIVVVFVLAGLIAAGVGLLFGIPSLRIKGFYLAVATLAAQFFLIWLFNKVAWFTNYASSGTITAPDRTIFGVLVTGPNSSASARYPWRSGWSPSSRSSPRTWCAGASAGRGWPSATATSPPRSSGCGRCPPSSSRSGSARSTAASPGRGSCSSTWAPPRPWPSTSASRSSSCSW